MYNLKDKIIDYNLAGRKLGIGYDDKFMKVVNNILYYDILGEFNKDVYAKLWHSVYIRIHNNIDNNS